MHETQSHQFLPRFDEMYSQTVNRHLLVMRRAHPSLAALAPVHDESDLLDTPNCLEIEEQDALVVHQDHLHLLHRVTWQSQRHQSLVVFRKKSMKVYAHRPFRNTIRLIQRVASSRKSLPPKTPSEKKKTRETKAVVVGSVCSVDASEVSRRVRERRARGAKKLFILATSPLPDDGDYNNHGSSNLTPLERHLSSHELQGNDDSPSVMSDVSTLTMSTLSSLARDRRKFSRDRRYSSSKLYARATGSY